MWALKGKYSCRSRMSSLAFIETNLSVNHNSPMTVIFMFTRKKKYIWSSFFYLFPFLKYLLCKVANILGGDMCRGKSSLAFLLWWNILKKNLTKEGLSADVYAEGEREKEKTGKGRRRERERRWTCRGREAPKSRGSGDVFQRKKMSEYTTDEPQNEQKLPKQQSSNEEQQFL